MKLLISSVMGVMALMVLGSPQFTGILFSDGDESTVATSETLTIEASEVTEGTSELGVPSGTCPDPNSGFVPEPAVPDFTTPGGWTEDLTIYDRDENGLVCVKDHPANSGRMEGGIIVIDTH